MDNIQSTSQQPTAASFDAPYNRNQVIYNALSQLKEAADQQHYGLFAHDANNEPRLINRLLTIYRAAFAEHEDMALIDEEGAIEVTVRSRSKTLTLAVGRDTGHAITEALVDMLVEQMANVQKRIITARERMAEPGFDGDPTRIRFVEWLLDPVPLVVLNTDPAKVGNYLENMDNEGALRNNPHYTPPAA